jgi:pyruvate,water dikinase
VLKTLERTKEDGIFTMPLGEVRLGDLARVGGKAAHLGEMLAAGLPVPAGFVVTTEACKRFLRSEPQVESWLKSLGGRDLQNPEALRAAAEKVRDRLGAIAVPDEVAAAIAAAPPSNSSDAWAVRSSATMEDSLEASFAGQHDSFLNVRGYKAVVHAVKRCWLSLFSERAISYRMRKGVGLDGGQMAVIVQQLIHSHVAGVMFTREPTGANSDTILIEAALGLGEAVVQGKVTPERILVSRLGLSIIRRDIGSQRMQTVSAKEGGVCERPLAPEKMRAPVLKDEIAAQLARMGLEVERLLDSPLDIEWSVHGSEIWLLQARPAVVLKALAGGHQSTGARPSNSSFEDRQIWTNANSGEVMPDVVTPMTWSILMPLLRELLNRLLRVGGVRVRNEQIMSLVAGRTYFNFTMVCALGRCIPGMKNRTLEEFLGGRQDTLLALGKIQVLDADLPKVEVRRLRLVVALPALALGFLLYTPRRGETAIERVRRANDELTRIESGQLSDEELLRTIQASFIPTAMRNISALAALGFGCAWTLIFFELCKQWFEAEGRSTANRLLAGVGELDSAAAGHELWQLAEFAASDQELKALLLSTDTFSSFALQLAGCRKGRDFLAQWNAFMYRHGHHTRGEIELFNARWSECPDFVLDMVRGYVEAIDAGHTSPIARQELLAGERAVLESKCKGRLRNPLKRALFSFFLHRAQKGGRFRENIKSEAIRSLALLRQLLLELGRRLAADERLADANDIFFLKIDELQSGSLWETETDLRALVAGRRTEYERNLKMNPPPVVVGRFDPDSFVPDSVDHRAKVFHGLGVSKGMATGRARVLLRSDANERVQPGEILVAPFTDPGWTPYFVAAAGIVMDLGGMLSHGSIVAREYGIPAVVNVGPATQVIRTGQWLKVDADQGVVQVLEK